MLSWHVKGLLVKLFYRRDELVKIAFVFIVLCPIQVNIGKGPMAITNLKAVVKKRFKETSSLEDRESSGISQTSVVIIVNEVKHSADTQSTS